MTDRELAGPQRSAWTPGSTVPRPEAARFRFTGSGSEYFRIWGLNLLLSVLTLGLYSAWAKVRREQYFHRNTQLAGSAFDYHGKPTAILKGRAIAVGGLALLQASSFVSPLLNAGLTLLLGLSVPWLIVRSLAFRLHNTSHRGLRFRFHGTTREALSLYFGYGVLNLLTLGLAFPAFYRAQTRFRFENAAFGATRFRFGAGLGRFYRLFGAALGLLFAVGGSLGAAVAMSGAFGALASSETAADSGEPAAVAAVAALMIASYLAGLSLFGAWFQVRIQNLIWNHARLGEHGFCCDQRVWPYLKLRLGNLVATLATLGLYRPFAAVRNARYQAKHLSFLPGGSLDRFVADATPAVGATGEEIAELFDFDIGL